MYNCISTLSCTVNKGMYSVARSALHVTVIVFKPICVCGPNRGLDLDCITECPYISMRSRDVLPIFLNIMYAYTNYNYMYVISITQGCTHAVTFK